MNPMTREGFRRMLASRDPAWTVFWVSLVLSLVAVWFDPMLNRDGMQYVDLATDALEQGPGAAAGDFRWPFFPLLIAGVAWLLPVGTEITAYGLCFIFLAGACFFLVRIAERLYPGKGWWAALVVLALPALQDYRSFVLREFGGWFFVMAGLWFVLRWRERGDWFSGLAFQLCIALATLFRIELAFVSAGVFLAFPLMEKARRGVPGFLTLFGLAAAVVVMGLFVLLLHDDVGMEGVAIYMNRFNPVTAWQDFTNTAQQFGATILHPFARDHGTLILFSGLMALFPARVLVAGGILLVPLVYHFRSGWWLRGRERDGHLFVILAFVYFLILVVYVLAKGYLSSRHASLIAVLLVPPMVEGLYALHGRVRHRRWRIGFLVVLVLLAGDALIQTGPGRVWIKHAGERLAELHNPGPDWYIEHPELDYYMTGHYTDTDNRPAQQAVLADGGRSYEVLVLNITGAEEADRLERFVRESPFEHERRVDGPKGQVIQILRRR